MSMSKNVANVSQQAKNQSKIMSESKQTYQEESKHAKQVSMHVSRKLCIRKQSYREICEWMDKWMIDNSNAKRVTHQTMVSKMNQKWLEKSITNERQMTDEQIVNRAPIRKSEWEQQIVWDSFSGINFSPCIDRGSLKEAKIGCRRVIWRANTRC